MPERGESRERACTIPFEFVVILLLTAYNYYEFSS